MKIKIFLFLKLSISLILLNSCSQDTEHELHNHSTDKYKIKKITYNEAFKNKKFKEVDNIITNKLNFKKRNISKFKNSSKLISSENELLFAIDSTLIKEVTTEDFISYTMKVILDSISYSDGSFDNLVVQIDNDQKIEAFLIHYKPDIDILYNPDHKTYTFEGSTSVSKVYGITSFLGNGLGDNGEDNGTNNTSEGAGGNDTYNSIICVTLLLCDYEYTHIAGPGCKNTYTRTECYSNPNYNPWSGYGNAPADETDLNNDNNNNGPGGGGLGSGNNTNNNQNSSFTTATVFTEELDDMNLQMQILREKNFREALNWNQKTWLNNNSNIETEIIDYLESQVENVIEDTGYPDEEINFIEELINLAIQYPTMYTYDNLMNWFFTTREGIDPISYDNNFWEDPNLSFPLQSLPSWSDFDIAYPRVDGSELVTIVGGAVQIAYNQYPNLSRGYCALKVSRALNYSGIIIPQIITTSGNPGTLQGSDGKYYFLNAKALNKWMRETFGTNPATNTSPLNLNHFHFTSNQGGINGLNFPNLMIGLKGIYSMVSTNPNWASGHADLIDENGICVFGCHLNDSPPAPIDYIDIWVLE
ncbi:MAG: hypothetical protein KA215_06835 [Flavobacterium sp.]|jgi:hypothetical protein|nr:hypothetical protein [Flavobacterium sp.]HQV35274.1 T6SS effector amidase Tae4 family protein [Flavobacterium sp.]HQX02680.1 T6SS effector amidase Tae4 family protein [Flavobacterium sp.]